MIQISAEALGADGLDQIRGPVVINVPLPVSGSIQIHAVDDALQQRVFLRDGPHLGRDALADLI